VADKLEACFEGYLLPTEKPPRLKPDTSIRNAFNSLSFIHRTSLSAQAYFNSLFNTIYTRLLSRRSTLTSWGTSHSWWRESSWWAHIRPSRPSHVRREREIWRWHARHWRHAARRWERHSLRRRASTIWRKRREWHVAWSPSYVWWRERHVRWHIRHIRHATVWGWNVY
jgi:hypothetical protein